MVDDFKKYLTVRGIAKKLGVTEEQSRDLIQAKKIKAAKIGQWRVKPKDLEEVIKYRGVLKARRVKSFFAGFDVTLDPVVVRAMPSRSPREGNVPALGKILVDMYLDIDILLSEKEKASLNEQLVAVAKSSGVFKSIEEDFIKGVLKTKIIRLI